MTNPPSEKAMRLARKLTHEIVPADLTRLYETRNLLRKLHSHGPNEDFKAFEDGVLQGIAHLIDAEFAAVLEERDEIAISLREALTAIETARRFILDAVECTTKEVT